jgi:hypothetical protein
MTAPTTYYKRIHSHTWCPRSVVCWPLNYKCRGIYLLASSIAIERSKAIVDDVTTKRHTNGFLFRKKQSEQRKCSYFRQISFKESFESTMNLSLCHPLCSSARCKKVEPTHKAETFQPTTPTHHQIPYNKMNPRIKYKIVIK